ncbi:MAG TPA: PAS domain S-box protein [Patescibacteria group bacterium]|nr:PAS domain S-box protein [Patescibacteria group bacterium]
MPGNLWTIVFTGVGLSVLLLALFRIQSKNTEAKIAASESRYKRLFETAQDGILVLDAYSGAILDANPLVEILLGYPKATLIGKHLWEIGAFADIAASKADFLKLQSKGSIHYENLPLQTKDGQVIDIEFLGNTYESGKDQVIQCNLRDIRQRKKFEKETKRRALELEQHKKALLNLMDDWSTEKTKLEEAKAKDEAILSSVGDGLFVIDMEGKIILVNRAFEEMLGWKLTEVKGEAFAKVVPSEDSKGCRISPDKHPMSIVLATGQEITSLGSGPSYYLIRKNKTKFPIAYKETVVKLGDKTIGVVGVFRDVTKEKEIDKAKTEFVSVASHQLRTPLGIVKWYLEVLQEESYIRHAPRTLRTYLDEIYKGNERVIALVRDLLSVSRIDQGLNKANPQSTDIIRLLKGVMDEMSVVSRKNKIKLHLAIEEPESLPAVCVDPLRLHEVLENLITNAIGYNHPGGSVEVAISRQAKDFLKIDVKDTGIGISDTDQKKLFTKFFRSAAGTTHKAEGSGLGLYVAQSYAKDWGGNINVQSEKGKGSVFSITLPIKKW